MIEYNLFFINGQIASVLKPTRGVHQRDLLPPNLYIIAKQIKELVLIASLRAIEKIYENCKIKTNLKTIFTSLRKGFYKSNLIKDKIKPPALI